MIKILTTYFKRRRTFFFWSALTLGMLFFSCITSFYFKEYENKNSQTDVHNAEVLFDLNDIPILKIKDIGKQYHPAWISMYALAYAGIDDPLNIRDENKFRKCIDWLSKNLKEKENGIYTWEYHFDSTYNDISIKAPWSSAFAQATGIQALIAAYKQLGKTEYLDLAKNAAKILFVPLEKGGFLFQKENDIWFEEIPVPIDNPGHILNGHMRVLLALKELADVTQDSEIESYFKRGMDTLYRWLPLFDSGYWFRYDLNPKKSELLFRFANPYGFENFPLAISKITLRDPITKEEVVLNVGREGDNSGESRIAGIHWGQPEQVAGRLSRRLVPVALDNQLDKMAAPHSYFYLPLPSMWKDNLRNDWFELTIDYYDETAANITIQQRSIAPGQTFKDIRDGDLHLTGAGHWRQWNIPLRPSDLGFWVGESYADKHAEYLKQLAQYDARFLTWTQLARMYCNVGSQKRSHYQEINHALPELPKQLPMLPIYSLDKNGIVTQNQATEKTFFLPDGSYDPTSDSGIPRYTPFGIALQLIQGSGITPKGIEKSNVKNENALLWLLEPNNQKIVENSTTYTFDFTNVYNNVITQAPWASAFSQAYVLKALQFAAENKMAQTEVIFDLINRVANSYQILVDAGGVATVSHDRYRFFEEVPNATHVLNAHLISISELISTSRYLNRSDLYDLAWEGIISLREKLHQFDSGYWFRYDLNPKKELLFQIDWVEGESSVLIERIELQDPVSETKAVIDVGSSMAFAGSSHISGIDWQTEQIVDDHKVRGFQNGYSIRDKPVPGGMLHNVFFVSMLPNHYISDYFNIPIHQLTIHYKDISPGRFVVNVQAIHEGNFTSFVPLRAGVINTIGDGQWKTARIAIRPQDLGWYVGPDYQKYEVEQLQRIAHFTNDWFFYQYAQRHQDFLKAQLNNKNIVQLRTQYEIDSPVSLNICDSSPTYPGYDFNNALTDDPSKNYVAGIEGDKIAYVDLELDKPKRLSEVFIKWENASNYARKVRIIMLEDKNDHNEVELLVVNNNKGSESHFELNDSKHVKKLRIEFSDFAGQPRLLLRKIQIFSVKNIENKKTSDLLNNPFLSAEDKNNPLHPFRLPVTMKTKILSDHLSIGAKSDHEKIVNFMSYIAQFRIGYASSASPEDTIMEQIGSCGTFTNTLLALAAGQGMQGRIINLHNYPKNYGHTVAEILFDGKWHLYDPTFAAFYTLNKKSDTLPLSFAEIREGYKKKPNTIKLVSNVYRKGFEFFTGKDIFLKANPAGLIGANHVMIFPNELNLSTHSKVEKNEMGLRFQGSDYIGVANINQHQNWILNGLLPGHTYNFVIYPDFLGGDISLENRKFLISIKLKGGILESEASHTFDFSMAIKPLIIKFIADKPQVTLNISHPYRGPEHRYVQVKQYELKEAQCEEQQKCAA